MLCFGSDIVVAGTKNYHCKINVKAQSNSGQFLQWLDFCFWGWEAIVLHTM